MPRGSEIMLQPSVPLELPAGQYLADVDETREKLGVGFHGALRAVVECNPSGQARERFYIFDRGDNPAGPALVDTSPMKTNLFLRNDERYVVMTQGGVDAMRQAATQNWSVKQRMGWHAYRSGTHLTIGRNEETQAAFAAGPMISTISRQHFNLTLPEDGRITVTDLGSANGTKVYS